MKNSRWIEIELSNDYRIKVNLFDYAATVKESFNKIIKNEEMEYQSLVSQIHATLLNREGYIKPYEYIIKRVSENRSDNWNYLAMYQPIRNRIFSDNL